MVIIEEIAEAGVEDGVVTTEVVDIGEVAVEDEVKPMKIRMKPAI